MFQFGEEMKIEAGDLVLINKTGTVGFVTNANSRKDFSIHILKRGTDSKTAWYDFEEATVLVPMSKSLEEAARILSSPLNGALK